MRYARSTYDIEDVRNIIRGVAFVFFLIGFSAALILVAVFR